LPGKPDIVLPRYKTAILVHGCFWHRHEGCKVASNPKSNVAFWEDKFERNVIRERRVASQLEAGGWRVIVAWECELKGKDRAIRVATAIARTLGRLPPDSSPLPSGNPAGLT
jgi:DNA mismatch endonuclease (patch repair protein)